MKVYVASSYVNRVQVSDYMDRLRALGATITVDWTKPRETATPELDLPLVEQGDIAVTALAGVTACDVFWLIAPGDGGCGCFIEFGSALTTRTFHAPKRVVIGSGPRRTVFATLADQWFDTHEDAYDLIATLQGEDHESTGPSHSTR
jgi:hypothetical protein